MRRGKSKIEGITLISLVITIVVLIILAGLAIYLGLSNNGIFNRTKEAKERTEYAFALEIVETKIIDANMEIISKEERLATLEELEEYFKKDTETEVELIKYEETAYLSKEIERPEKIKGFWVKVIKYNKYSFLIGKEGKIDALSLDNGITKMTLEDYTNNIGKIEQKDPIGDIKIEINDINGEYFTIKVNTKSSQGKIVKYEYFINGESKGITTDTNMKLITDLELGTEYAIQVKVTDEKGNNRISAQVKQKTLDKLYLYKSKNEYSELTQGWEFRTYQYNPLFSKDNEYLYINSTSNGSAGYTCMKNENFDFSKFSKLCVKWTKQKVNKDAHFTIIAGEFNLENGSPGQICDDRHFTYTFRDYLETDLNKDITEELEFDISKLKNKGSIYLYVYQGYLKVHEVYLY